jgi:hypothetical protein
MKKLFIIAIILMVTNRMLAQTGPDYQLHLQLVDESSVFESPDYYTWGGSPIKGNDGLYHLYYSRWEKKYGFMAWVTHSEIAHAVSKSPLGPYVFHDVVFPRRGKQYWDGMNTHNPTVHFFNGKYYLYYTGNTGDDNNVVGQLNFSHRNNQRLGVAVADSPYGPWKRFDKPVIDVSADSTAPDALMMANPSITQMKDGRYLMIYKGVAKKNPGIFGGPVVHLCAIAKSPLGPFKKILKPIFIVKDSPFPAEDPYIWLQGKYYYAIVKDFHGAFTHHGLSLALFYSKNGIDWKPVNNCLLTVPEIHWKNGKVTKLKFLERPQLLIEHGKPTALFLAAHELEDSTNMGKANTFNVHIALK